MDLKQKLLDCITDPGIEFGIALHHIESGEATLINADSVFPTASVFKVPVMVEVFKQAKEGKFTIDDRLKLLDKHKTLPSGVLFALQEGLMPSIQDLLVLMIIISDNVATTMLLDLIDVEHVNATMQALGLYATHVNMTVHEMFLHAFGIAERKIIPIEELFQVAQSVPMDYRTRTFSREDDNNVSSAGDMARLMTMIQKGEVVDREACDRMRLIMSLQQYSTRVSHFLPWMSVAHKGGTLRGIRNDCGIITCSQDSHVAYGVFSFDPQPKPFMDPRPEVRQNTRVDNMMAKMGLAIYKHYGGRWG